MSKYPFGRGGYNDLHGDRGKGKIVTTPAQPPAPATALDALRELSEAVSALANYFNDPATEHVDEWLRLNNAQAKAREVLSRQ